MNNESGEKTKLVFRVSTRKKKQKNKTLEIQIYHKILTHKHKHYLQLSKSISHPVRPQGKEGRSSDMPEVSLYFVVFDKK